MLDPAIRLLFQHHNGRFSDAAFSGDKVTLRLGNAIHFMIPTLFAKSLFCLQMPLSRSIRSSFQRNRMTLSSRENAMPEAQTLRIHAVSSQRTPLLPYKQTKEAVMQFCREQGNKAAPFHPAEWGEASSGGSAAIPDHLIINY
jgi:hypothetical protein